MYKNASNRNSILFFVKIVFEIFFLADVSKLFSATMFFWNRKIRLSILLLYYCYKYFKKQISPILNFSSIHIEYVQQRIFFKDLHYTCIFGFVVSFLIFHGHVVLHYKLTNVMCFTENAICLMYAIIHLGVSLHLNNAYTNGNLQA